MRSTFYQLKSVNQTLSFGDLEFDLFMGFVQMIDWIGWDGMECVCACARKYTLGMAIFMLQCGKNHLIQWLEQWTQAAAAASLFWQNIMGTRKLAHSEQTLYGQW